MISVMYFTAMVKASMDEIQTQHSKHEIVCGNIYSFENGMTQE